LQTWGGWVQDGKDLLCDDWLLRGGHCFFTAYSVIARKLLVAVWHVLTDRAADRHACAQQVADKFLLWSRF
jgi:hypothetical protein